MSGGEAGHLEYEGLNCRVRLPDLRPKNLLSFCKSVGRSEVVHVSLEV